MSTYRRRHRISQATRTNLRWLLIISLVAIFIAAALGLGGGLINFLDKHANVLDNQYIPKDIDPATLDTLKKTFDKQQGKPIDSATLEKLKKSFNQRQLKP